MIKATASFPIFIVENLPAALEFYTSYLDFSPVFETDWYIHLVSKAGIQIGFMVPNHPSQPERLHCCYSGDGAVFSLEVDDADEAYACTKSEGLTIVEDIKTEEWGQRHFILSDPNRVIIDIVQNTQPNEEYQDNYVS